MRLYHILHKNSFGHLSYTSRDYFWRPPPAQTFRKEMDNICIIFVCTFPRVFVVFVVLVTEIWPKNIDLIVTAKC